MSTSILDLPNGITTRIFKGIPLSSIQAYRAVCKDWNSLIMSAEFSPLRSAQIHHKPMLVVNDHVKGCSIRMYSSKSDAWVDIPLPLLINLPRHGPLYLTASSGGLMCFDTCDRKSFIIWNPVTNKWRHLQLPTVAKDGYLARRVCSCLNPTFCIHKTGNMPNTLTGLIVDRRVGSYKVIVALLAERDELRKTFIYDSSRGSWTSGAKVPEGMGFVNPVALSVKENIYCLIGEEDRRMVAKYDVKHDIWYCSAPLFREVWPHFHRKNEVELIEFDGGVKLFARRVNRHLRYRPFYNVDGSGLEVFNVFETSSGIEIKGVQDNEMDKRFMWRLRPHRVCVRNIYLTDSPYEVADWQALASAYSASYVGHDSTVYTLGRVYKNRNDMDPGMFHVMKIDSVLHYVTAGRTLLLPGLRKQQSLNDIQVELKLFEPSLTAQV